MKIPAKVVFILAIVAGLLEVVNRVVLSIDPVAHTVISLVLMFTIGVGIVPFTAEQVGKLIPLHVAVGLTSLAGVLQVLQQQELHIGSVPHALIGLLLYVLAALRIAPAVTSVVGAVRPSRHAQAAERHRL